MNIEYAYNIYFFSYDVAEVERTLKYCGKSFV